MFLRRKVIHPQITQMTQMKTELRILTLNPEPER